MANGSISYFGVDGLGTVVISTDIAGTVLSSSGYSPWGELSVLPAPELFGYTGREAGGPSWYYRARYYDSTNGRFLSEDPLRFAGGVNVYAYANNDPAQLVDPFGLSSEEPKSCDYSPDDCTSLARKIEAALKELRRLLKNERKQQATGTAFDGYDGHLEQYQNRQRQLRRLLGRFRDRNCNPALVRDDIEQWLSEEYPPPPSTFWERYKKQVAQNWDNLWRQLARGPQGPKGLPLPPFPMPAFP
jgi:RHS repeat-associated protein